MKIKIWIIVSFIVIGAITAPVIALAVISDPTETLYTTTKDWWNNGKMGALIATGGIMAGASAFAYQHKPSYFFIPATAGVAIGSAFGLGTFLMGIGQQMFP